MEHTIFISENKLKEDQQEELMRLELETFHTKHHIREKMDWPAETIDIKFTSILSLQQEATHLKGRHLILTY